MANRSTTLARQSLDVWRDWTAAAITIAARTPILYEAAVNGSPQALVESQRMVAEKALAAAEGMAAAGAAWTDFWLRLSLGAARPDAMAKELTKIAQAATRPASRACRANARRLTRKPRKR